MNSYGVQIRTLRPFKKIAIFHHFLIFKGSLVQQRGNIYTKGLHIS